MRNRAKCKLCGDVIESAYKHDYVICSCGEIAVDGGEEYRRCVAKNPDNFLALDDEDNVIPIKHAAPQQNTPPPLHKNDLIIEEIIAEAIKETERVIECDTSARVTQFDMLSLLYLLKEIVKRLPPS